jgi:hypothetical protein
MKTLRLPLALLLVTLSVGAQDAAPAPPGAVPAMSNRRTAEELDQLLGPIALYPDALIAIILPASTAPTDIVLAARHVRDNPGDRAQIEHRAWDESVKSLTNYPEVLQWMDENLHWTRQVGEAFLEQPADVMQAVQRLRAKARAAGTLVDTPQQQVISEPQVIRIVPAQPDVIYVPHYEPEVVFVDRPVYYSRPFLTFGIGVPVGSWLAYDCDWRRNSIWIGNRHRPWVRHDWHRPLVPIHSFNHHAHPPPGVRQWRPPPAPVRTVIAGTRFRSEIARPAPFGLAANRTHSFRDSGSSSSSRSDSSRSRVVPSTPRSSINPGFRDANSGSRATTTVVAPPLPTARADTQPSIAPRIAPLPNSRAGGERTRDITSRGVGESHRTGGDTHRSVGDTHRSTADANRDYGNRSRAFRNQTQASTPPAAVTAPPVMSAAPVTAPSPRTFDSSRSAGQPRTFSHRSSAPESMSAPAQRMSAPAVVPSMPMRSRSVPSAAVVPVAPQAAPQAAAQSAPAAAPQAAAPAQRSGGEYRGGHRGAGVRREN